MASIGAQNYPYIQHRGGPKGFLKVLDSKRIGFIDFRGNMQFISVGNIATNHNISLIMVDYPARTRLKIYAKAYVVELADDPVLYQSLDLEAYEFRPERMMVFNIEAYDWNCPQHITPRYTVEEIRELYASQQEHIEHLTGQVKNLLAKIKELQI
jgi:predicted pyridoxine 5'-phosphate oxidase superfamily flavin-nucleotide-binding protein